MRSGVRLISLASGSTRNQIIKNFSTYFVSWWESFQTKGEIWWICIFVVLVEIGCSVHVGQNKDHGCHGFYQIFQVSESPIAPNTLNKKNKGRFITLTSQA